MSEQPMSPRSAERLVRGARAAQALSETLWEALHEELADPTAQRVTELSARLADVSATVAVLARADSGSGAAPEAPLPPVEPEQPAERATDEQASSHRESPAAREPKPVARESPSPAVIVDELAPGVAPEIEIRDERSEHAPTAWVASIARLVERRARDGAPFAVLLVELVDVERLRHAELPGEVARLTGLVEVAIERELRPADSLTRESPGRYWLLAPETDSNSAKELADRLAGAVRAGASHRGASLEIAVGIAVCPVDGSQATALAVSAEIALYAARASGRPVA